jgi:toxin ParE1/3/4
MRNTSVVKTQFAPHKVTAFQVKYSPHAERDLREAWRHIAQHNKDAADRFLLAVDTAVSSLVHSPEIGAPRPEMAKGIRMLVEGKYLIFYLVNGKKIMVARIIHGSRDRTKAFNS